jgi:hypothetical protein
LLTGELEKSIQFSIHLKRNEPLGMNNDGLYKRGTQLSCAPFAWLIGGTPTSKQSHEHAYA